MAGRLRALRPEEAGRLSQNFHSGKFFSRSSPEHSRGTWLPVGPTATERSLRLGGLSKGSGIPRLVQGPRKDRFLSRPLKRFLMGRSVVPPKVEEIRPVASTRYVTEGSTMVTIRDIRLQIKNVVVIRWQVIFRPKNVSVESFLTVFC